MNPSDISRWQGSVDSWLAQGCTQGRLANPGDNYNLADTAGLVAGYYDFTIILASTGNHYFAEIQHRNAINDTTLNLWYGVWGVYAVSSIFINNWKIVANERLRVLVNSASDDTLTATIYWSIRA